jgi:hypothetical protein
MVELPDALEPGVGSNLRDWQLVLVEKVARKMYPARARDLYR